MRLSRWIGSRVLRQEFVADCCAGRWTVTAWAKAVGIERAPSRVLRSSAAARGRRTVGKFL